MFGCPGVGKGTQAKLLAKSLGITHFSTGDILRNAVDNETAAGKEAKEYMKKGELVPDEVLSDIIQDVIHESNGFILDGYPRNKQQVKYFFEIMSQESRQLNKVVYLKADREICIKRMKARGRDNETEKTIKKRIKIYEEETLPIIEMFPPSKVMIVKTLNKPEAVNQDILETLSHSFSQEIFSG